MKTLVMVMLAAALVAGCETQVAPRNTIQASAIAKDDLQGVFYFRQTVVGVPFTTGFTFVGEQGDNEMEKIRWDIQEEQLIARRAYEYVKGSEASEANNKLGVDGTYLGAPVAAFKIKSQFDIVRDYNASTGEEYDKLVENTERKWYERRFIRVDWSQNLVTNFNFLADFSTGSVTALKQDAAPYAVTDPNDVDAMRLERATDTSPANYLEVTQKLIVQPESVTFDDGTSWPLCFLEYSTTDCASQTIRVRNSFLRAEPRDYEPQVYDDHMMEHFGFFTVDRMTYNRQYGLTQTGLQRLINRHNIWRHSLTTQTCKADAECGAAQPGKRCVTELPGATVNPDGSVIGVCSLPYGVRNLADPADASSAELGPRPVVYYLNDSFPADLKPMAQELGRQYDETLKGIYKSLLGKDSPTPMFVVCPNNPVEDTDPSECGAAKTHVRLGDIRYNLMNWVDEPTSAALLGYGPNSNDPETGEVISSLANIYGAPTDTYATFARDLVRLTNGEIAPDKFINGENVQQWVGSNPLGAHSRTLDQAGVDALASQMDLSWMRGLPRHPAVRKGNVALTRQSAADRAAMLRGGNLMGTDPGLTSRRLAKLAGTDVEKQLVSGEVLMARGIDPRTSLASIDAARIRPEQVFNPEQRQLIQRERRRLSAKGVDMAYTIDDTVLGFALLQKGKDPQEVWKKIREQVFLSTALHEVGHTMGLRHNFSGSYDPMNYPKTYWDLRTVNGTKTPLPRYLDPISQVELDGVIKPNGLRAGIAEFMQSSLMDYGANFNSDIDGLGRYDRAALKFGYAGLVEVFTDVKDPFLLGALQASVTYGEAQPLLSDCTGTNWTSVHYTRLPQLVTLDARADVPWSTITKQIVKPSCPAADLVEADPMKRIVVPYKFCSDEFEGASTDCNMFDRGADVYEVTRSAIDNYKSYYIFDDFRRERLGFSPESHLDRLYSRYLDPIRNTMQFYVLYRSLYDDGSGDPFWTAPAGWGPYTVAVSDGFDFFGDVLTMPEPGPYQLYLGDDGREAYFQDSYGSGPPAFTLDLGEGRYFSTEWEYDSGYFWYERVHHVGSFLDKVAALSELVDPETYFIGKDLSSDLRQYAINYSRIYSKQVTDLWAAGLTDRWDRYAPVFDPGTNQFIRRPISRPITIPTGNIRPVDPQLGFTVELWMASLGAALLPATFDTSYADSSRLWLAGNGAAIIPSLPVVSFTDPATGKVFTAVSYKAGVIETGVAARMIARAEELKGKLNPADPTTQTALTNYVQLLEAQRSISAVYTDALH